MNKEYPEPPEPNACGGYYCSEEHGHIDCKGSGLVITDGRPQIIPDPPRFPRVNRCHACGRFISVGRIYCDNCHDCEDDHE